ncbi:MAG: hypothetical protein JWO75_2977 [Actinomycetia bacterium]|nr:hypothetical protein [Actinomycetes bacterium]
MAEGDVPGGTGTGGNATGGDGDEDVWLDLVARFDAPAPAGEAPPWPDREDLAGPVRVTPIAPPPVPEALPGEPPTNPTGLPGLPVHGGVSMPDNTGPDNTGPVAGNTVPDETLPDRPWPGLGARTGPRDVPSADNRANDHFVPPVPPPLPRLDPVTKGAWVALFGGPLYLLISTAIGATISGLAAFLAVAAFVGGFVILVLRMDNGRPPDSGSDDDGAVV